MTVLDASAVLAYLRDEPGSELVEQALGGEALISTVNLAEVLSKLADVGEDPTRAMRGIELLPLELVPFDVDQAVEVARLRRPTMKAGLSLADRVCLALAVARGLRALSADRQWADLLPEVEVVAIR